jgi:site-specific DNA recombinase
VKTIALYARVSSAEQASDGVSLDAQETELRKWASTQDSEVVVFREEGKSAYSGKRRPEYEKMIAAVERGEVSIIASTRPDRLHRSVLEGIRLRQLCNAHGTRIWSASTGWVDTSAFGTFNANMLAAVAELESAIRSERVTDAFSYLRAEGIHVGPPPWGYVRTPGTRRIVPSADARLVQRVFVLYGDEGWSLSQIRDWLLSEPREERTTVTVPYLSKLLGNATYAGYVVSDTKSAEPTLHRGNHHPLCPPELWERVQARRERNRKRGYTGSKYLPFGKLARCAHCLGPLRWKKTADDLYFYVRCNADCGAKAMPSQHFEAGVAAYIDTAIIYIDRALNDGSWRDLTPNRADLDAATDALAKAQEARENVRRAMRDGLLSDAEAKADLTTTKARVAKYEAVVKRLSVSADELHADLVWLRDTLLNGEQSFTAWWTTGQHPDRIKTLEVALEGVWLGDDGLMFKYRRGLNLPFVVPYIRSRYSRQVSDELTKIGFPPRLPEPAAGLRSPRPERLGGRSRIPPCGAPPARDSP